MNETETLVIALYDMPKMDALDQLAPEFTRRTGIGVQLERLPTDLLETRTMERFMRTATDFDLVDVSTAALPSFAPYLQPLDTWLDRDRVDVQPDDWSESILDLYGRHSGSLVALPFRVNLYMLYYRRDLFKEAGLAPPLDLDTLLEAARTLHRPEAGIYGFASSQENGLRICLDWLPVLWGLGGQIMDRRERACLDSPEARAALEYYVARNRYAPPQVGDFSYFDPLRLMQRGEVAMIQQWSTAAFALEDPAQSSVVGRIGYLPAPGTPIIGGGGLGINGYSRHKAAAWQFLKWITSPAVEKRRVALGDSPTRRSTFNDEGLAQRHRYLETVLAGLERGRQRPAHPEWSRLQAIIGDAVWLAAHSARPAAQALAVAQERLQTVLTWNRQIAYLTAIASSLSRASDERMLLSQVLLQTVALFGGDLGVVCLLDAGGRTPQRVLRVSAKDNVVEELDASVVHVGRLQALLRSPLPCWSLTSQNTPALADEWLPFDQLQTSARNWIGCRIGPGVNPVGLMMTALRQPYHLKRQELDLMVAVGQQVGRAIENLRLSAQVRSSEEYLRLIVEDSPAAIVVLEPDGTVRVWSPAAEEIFGWPAREVKGRFYPAVPEDQLPEFFQHMDRLRQGEKLRNVELRRIREDGTPVDVSLNASALHDEKGNMIGYVGVYSDISARKAALEALVLRNRRLELLQQIDRAILTADSTQTLLATTLSSLRDLVGCDRISLAIVEPDSRQLRLAAVSVASQTQVGEGQPVPWEAFGEEAAFRDGHMHVVTDTDEINLKTEVMNRLRAEGIRSYFNVPLLAQDELIGALNLAWRRLDAFGAQEMAIAGEVAATLSIALWQARLRDQLHALANYLQEMREAERTSIAREIHDEFGQALTALKIDLAWLSRRLPEGEPALRDKIRSMTGLVDDSIGLVRRIATELRPGLLDDLGLTAAIEWQAEEFNKRTGIDVRLELPVEEPTLDRNLATAIFRIFQETLTNVIRHAGASQVWVTLKSTPQEITLTVRDDGSGIAPEEAISPKSLGLLGMRERASAWGGRLVFEGQPGRGTTVRLTLPISSP